MDPTARAINDYPWPPLAHRRRGWPPIAAFNRAQAVLQWIHHASSGVQAVATQSIHNLCVSLYVSDWESALHTHGRFEVSELNLWNSFSDSKPSWFGAGDVPSGSCRHRVESRGLGGCVAWSACEDCPRADSGQCLCGFFWDPRVEFTQSVLKDLDVSKST